MILLTGATGFIGSHTWIELLQSGYEVVGIDNFSNSTAEVLKRLSILCGSKINFHKLDVRDTAKLNQFFHDYSITSIMHFAGLKSVSESVNSPLKYYDNNVSGLISLLQVAHKFKVRKIVFSSSATVYDQTNSIPYNESMPLRASNPYGETKFISEKILLDLQKADSNWKVACLRYFNPAGAHQSGLLGEDPLGTPNNLMPYISQVAAGLRPHLNIYGADWPTIDGTGVRDYIHVTDLAQGHVNALNYLNKADEKNITVNLGRGSGYSVLEILFAFEKVCGHSIPYKFVDRRPGDIAAYFADVTCAQKKLNWTAKFDLADMCRDSWNWQINNKKNIYKY